MVMEETSLGEIRHVVEFFWQLELEPSLKGLGLPYNPGQISEVAAKSVASDPMKNMPFTVDIQNVISAIAQTEELMKTL